MTLAVARVSHKQGFPRGEANPKAERVLWTGRRENQGLAGLKWGQALPSPKTTLNQVHQGRRVGGMLLLIIGWLILVCVEGFPGEFNEHDDRTSICTLEEGTDRRGG